MFDKSPNAEVYDNNPLIQAIRDLNWNIGIELVNGGTDVNQGNPLCELLLRAREYFDGPKKELAEKLVEQGADIQVVDSEGNNLLQKLIRLYDKQFSEAYEKMPNGRAMSWLIEKGISVNHVNLRGFSSLDYSIISDSELIACFLIDSGADFKSLRVIPRATPWEQNTNQIPVFQAALANKEQIVRKMIEGGVDLNCKADNHCILDYINTKEMYNLLYEYRYRFDDELYHLFTRQRLKYVM